MNSIWTCGICMVILLQNVYCGAMDRKKLVDDVFSSGGRGVAQIYRPQQKTMDDPDEVETNEQNICRCDEECQTKCVSICCQGALWGCVVFAFANCMKAVINIGNNGHAVKEY